jgi:uncharacterized protein
MESGHITRSWEDDVGNTPESQLPDGAVPSAGGLSPEYLDLVMRHLPLAVAVLDDKDTLIYWRGSRFAYCDKKWIGRDVRDCHTPVQNEAILRIVAAFRCGDCDHATFWKRYEGRLYLHRYAAMHDDEGEYRGFLSTLEDVTETIGLTGEKSALDWQGP